MDKNKSKFKLEGLPHIYWLNLDSDVDRRQYMESQFEYWEITNHTRISGYDGRVDAVEKEAKKNSNFRLKAHATIGTLGVVFGVIGAFLGKIFGWFIGK